MMLQKIERHTTARIQRDDFPVDECIGRKPFTGLGDTGKLLCEKILSPGPESHSGGISPGKTTVSVELNLVEPFLAVGQALNQPCIHGLDKPDFGGRQRAEGLGSHEEFERAVRTFTGSFSFFSHFSLWRYRLLFFLDCRFVSSFSDNVLSCFALGLYRLLFFLSCRRRYRCLFPLFQDDYFGDPSLSGR